MSYKAGFIGLVGMPNAGKSTLVNVLVEQPVAVVSDKPQTTRQAIQGIVTTDEAQFVFVDTPGTIDSNQGLNPFLKFELGRVIEDSDSLVLVLAADEKDEDAILQLIEQIEGSKKKWVCVVSKSDLKASETSQKIQSQLREKGVIVLRVSSKKTPKDTRSRLLEEFFELLPDSPAPLFDTDLFTTENLREIAREKVREQCFLKLKQEIPYGLGVRINRFLEDDKVTRIYAEILVEKENHKSIVIGGKGAMLKKIGTEARKQIEPFVGTKVFLDLHVQYRRSWTKDPIFLKELGYDITNPES